MEIVGYNNPNKQIGVNMKPKAYMYIRFSTPQQSKGDSIRRQTESSERFAEQYDLELDNSLNLNDYGVSAYKGAHIEQGNLGVFLNAIETGEVSEGSYLLIEDLDRLSRQSLNQALPLFISILSKGIKIATLSDNMVYDKNYGILELMRSSLSMERAHEESVRKGELVKKAWDNKKTKIDEYKLTKWSPKWLDLSPDRKSFIINEERAEVIRKIFQWSISGLGTNLILRQLEVLRIEPWAPGSDIKSDLKTPKEWYSSYIQRVLTNRSALGEFKLKKSRESKDYEIVYDYYPRIIDEDTFYRSQESRLKRKVSNKSGGRKGKTISNLFSKVARCGYSIQNQSSTRHQCYTSDQPMMYVNKGKNIPIKYLQCTRAKHGAAGCVLCGKLVRYEDFELSFLNNMSQIDLNELIGNTTALTEEIKQIKSSIASATVDTDKAKSVLEIIKGMGLEDIDRASWINEQSLSLERIIETTPSVIGAYNLRLAQLHKEQTSPVEIKNQIARLIALLSKSDEDDLLILRSSLSQLIKDNVKSIDVYANGHVYSDNYLIELAKEGFWHMKDIRLQYEQRFDNNGARRYMIKMKRGIRKAYYEINFKSGEKLTVYMYA